MIIAKKFLNKTVKEALEIITIERKKTDITDEQFHRIYELLDGCANTNDDTYTTWTDDDGFEGINVENAIKVMKTQIEYYEDTELTPEDRAEYDEKIVELDEAIKFITKWKEYSIHHEEDEPEK